MVKVLLPKFKGCKAREELSQIELGDSSRGVVPLPGPNNSSIYNKKCGDRDMGWLYICTRCMQREGLEW